MDKDGFLFSTSSCPLVNHLSVGSRKMNLESPSRMINRHLLFEGFILGNRKLIKEMNKWIGETAWLKGSICAFFKRAANRTTKKSAA